MDHAIYFADKVLHIVSADDPAAITAGAVVVREPITRAKVLKFFETSNLLVFLAGDPDAAFAAFSREFRRVEAAGGVVTDCRGERLMIFRNGRWDLPKGHLEAGETLGECALREVEEETGVKPETLVRPLCRTIHCYELRGRWEMKHTFWYEMRVEEALCPKPQREEGIVRAVWCTDDEVRTHLKSSYPTIRRVFEALESGAAE